MKFLVTDGSFNRGVFELSSGECIVVTANNPEQAAQRFLDEAGNDPYNDDIDMVMVFPIESAAPYRVVKRAAYDLVPANHPPKPRLKQKKKHPLDGTVPVDVDLDVLAKKEV